MKPYPALLAAPRLLKGSLGAVPLSWLAGSLLACTDHLRNHSACRSLRQNHERIAEIETSLHKLASEPPSDKRDLRMADLEKRRRMYLSDNDRQQALCHPIGEDRPLDPFITDLHPLDPRR